MIRPIGRLRLGIDILVAAAFCAMVQFLAVPVELGGPSNPLVTAFMGTALAIRRLSPGGSLAIAWLGAIVQMLFGMDPMLANVAIAGVLYVTSAYGNRLVMWLGLASALMGALTVGAYVTLRYLGPFGGGMTSAIDLLLPAMFAPLFAFALSWTAGALVRATRRAQQNREAQRRAEESAAAEHERGRIARDMHDVVAHSLTVVVAQANGARYAARTDLEVATEALATISETAGAALADVRVLLAQLRHKESDGPQPTIADLDALFAQLRQAGLGLAVDIDPAPRGEVPAAVQLAVYRILQEALTNALRHGGGSADVRIAWRPGSVSLAVRNPVAAAPGAGVSQGGNLGHGIIGMRERAALVGGSLDVEQSASEFAVSAQLSWEDT